MDNIKFLEYGSGAFGDYGFEDGSLVNFTSTPPDARIWIDDIDQNVNTPNTIPGLSLGNHTFKLVYGIYTATGNFTVTTDIITDVSVVIAVTPYTIASNTYACIYPCQVTISAIWKNNGNTDITFRPTITIDTVHIIQASSDITIAVGATSDQVLIDTPTLSQALHHICMFLG